MNKKVFECSKNCKNCTYENKQCGGYDEFSECISDKCPLGNYAIGNIDSVGGKHTSEGNWNPVGERCSLCAPKDCTNCDKWKRRQSQNTTTPKAETPKKPSTSTADMWGAIFDDVYDLNDAPNTKTIAKEESATKVDDSIKNIAHDEEKVEIKEEIEEPIVEEPVEEVSVQDEMPEDEEMPAPSFVEVEEPDIPDEPEIPEDIEEPELVNELELINEPEQTEPIQEESPIAEEVNEEFKIEEKKEEPVIEKAQPKKASIFDDDDDFDYSMFKNASLKKWPNKPAIVIEPKVDEHKIDDVPESQEIVEFVAEEKTEEKEIEVTPAIEEVVTMEPAVETENIEEVTETEAEMPLVVEEEVPPEIDNIPITLEPEDEEEVEEKEPEAVQKKLFDTSLFSKWFKRSKPTKNAPNAQPKEETEIKDEIPEKPLENSENCDIIKEEKMEPCVELQEVSQNNHEPINENDEDANDIPANMSDPSVNEYIKASWLDDDDTYDYDENGNIVQGIYRIDKSGNKTIVTAFDDDTNVKYIKTSRPEISTSFRGNGNDSRVVEMSTNAWQISEVIEEPTEAAEEGIVEYTNQFPTSEVIDVEKPKTNHIFDTPTEEEPKPEREDDNTEETISADGAEDESDGDDIDFGEDFTSEDDGYGFDDGYNDALFEQDEIPEPEEYRMEREEYEEAGIEADEAEEVDEEYEDADFDMTDSAKFKASLLTPIGEEIAKLQINNTGVYLSVLGDCKITIKGRNDSDGFSYRDARRFPKYIIDKVLNKSIYRDPNMEVIDNTYFNLTYYEIKNGEIIPIDDVKLDVVFENPTPDSVKEVLYSEYKKFINK